MSVNYRSNPTQRYVDAQIAKLLLVLLKGGAKISSSMIDSVNIIYKGESLLDKLGATHPELINSPDFDATDNIREIFKKIAKNRNKKALLRKWLIELMEEKTVRSTPLPKAYQDAEKWFRESIRLDNNCIKICHCIYALRQPHSSVECLIRENVHTRREGAALIGKVLGISTKKMNEYLDFLINLGIIEDYGTNFSISEPMLDLWRGGDSPFAECLTKVQPNDTAPQELCQTPEQAEYLIKLLRDSGNESVHILLYGEPGTGKTFLTESLAGALGAQAWSLAYSGIQTISMHSNKRINDNLVRLCMRIASLNPGSFLVIDEAEYFLEDINKALLNELMEIKDRRVIWIVNRYWRINSAVKRRFNYSIFFPKPGTARRRKQWESILAKHRLELEEEQLETLVAGYPVTAGIIATAVKNAETLKYSAPYSVIDESLRAYTQLINNGQKVKKYKVSGDFSPNAICTQNEPATLLKQVEQLYGIEEPRATMLFYGPPGTGKTALARYIAKKLDKEAVVKRGSDIFGSYVGETEENIARAFAEAEYSGDVLIFDEADSFIYSRDTAQRSWESSFVNEFLTNLEEFRGICICTTNRRDNMDAAAMRRFSFKVPFVYAGREQILALYEALVAQFVDSPLPEECKQKLAAMGNLTPGDFHAVRLESRLDPIGSLTHEELIRRLRHETELKLEKGSVIGFNAG